MLPVQLPVPLNGCNCRTSCFLLLLMAVEMDETNLIGPQMHVRSTEKMRAAGQPPAPECFAFHRRSRRARELGSKVTRGPAKSHGAV